MSSILKERNVQSYVQGFMICLSHEGVNFLFVILFLCPFKTYKVMPTLISKIYQDQLVVISDICSALCFEVNKYILQTFLLVDVQPYLE